MKTVAIKAGSSVFDDTSKYDIVANALLQLSGHFDRIYFVVSALKGETDRTIDALARGKRDEVGKDYEELRYALDQGLRNNPQPLTTLFQNRETARALVRPEEQSVDMLVAALTDQGILSVGVTHGASYPIIGDGDYLYAKPNLELSKVHRPDYDAQIVVVAGFGIRNLAGDVLSTGRGSSDLTVIYIATLYGVDNVIYWKGPSGLYKPGDPAENIIEKIERGPATRMFWNQGVLDNRVFNFPGGIRVTGLGQTDKGTYIQPPVN